MISNLKSDIAFGAIKRSSFPVKYNGTWPLAENSSSAIVLRSIQTRRSGRSSSTQQPSSSAASRPSPVPSVTRCANSRRHYERAQAA